MLTKIPAPKQKGVTSKILIIPNSQHLCHTMKLHHLSLSHHLSLLNICLSCLSSFSLTTYPFLSLPSQVSQHLFLQLTTYLSLLPTFSPRHSSLLPTTYLSLHLTVSPRHYHLSLPITIYLSLSPPFAPSHHLFSSNQQNLSSTTYLSISPTPIFPPHLSLSLPISYSPNLSLSPPISLSLSPSGHLYIYLWPSSNPSLSPLISTSCFLSLTT